MDIITDLSSEAVSYLTVIQAMCRRGIDKQLPVNSGKGMLWETFALLDEHLLALAADFRPRIDEIIWSGDGLQLNVAQKLKEHKGAAVHEDHEKAQKEFEVKAQVFVARANRLLAWLQGIIDKTDINYLPIELTGLKGTPDVWRRHIRRILYIHRDERLNLAGALNYMPVQVLYALVADLPEDLRTLRLYQSFKGNDWNEDQDVAPLFSQSEIAEITKFWTQAFVPPQIPAESRNEEDLRSEKDHGASNDGTEVLEGPLSEVVKALLRHDQMLLHTLDSRNITVPFNTLFVKELRHIALLRKNRIEDFHQDMTTEFSKAPVTEIHDPEHKADEMQLTGLAFSGGGIRSATFNLGILQKLAEVDALPRFDYLSTVSGGGYIGAWYSSWIYRQGSMKKVTDRLNVKKSTDPLAEEVRPIRWLRMYSNYLSPNTGIMSTDSWTVGITWIRNTIINQAILLMILVTVLAFIDLVFDLWKAKAYGKLLESLYIPIMTALLIVGTWLMASGMRIYTKSTRFSRFFWTGKWRKNLPLALTIWACISGLFAALICYFNTSELSFLEKCFDTWPVAVAFFICALLIAGIGGYHRRSEENSGGTVTCSKLVAWILISSAVASLAALVLINMCRIFIHAIIGWNDGDKWAFILGTPMIMEAFAIAVVVRMAIMGSLFPDERREWWGRIGAMVHRLIVCWLLVTTAALWFPQTFVTACKCYFGQFITLVGGWAAVIGIAVRMAYNSKEAGDKPSSGTQQARDIFVRIAPYLFMIGFLIAGAYTLKAMELNIGSLRGKGIFVGLIAITTLFLSWRVGVNEFSLHDFYRNRLVRAYLGATRRRADREKSANFFTMFDKEDDITLASFADGNYCGPYPLVNTALNSTNVSQLDRQDRKAESFVFTPLYCGFDFNPTRSASQMTSNIFKFGYRPTAKYSRPSGPLLGTAMAISGAAVSPNQGYHSSPATSFLLTMFNLRLGRWIGNPRGQWYHRSDPKFGLGYLLKDLGGSSDIDADYVYLSDGGHFDNMGIYELVRRRCHYIVVGDGEQDENAVCEGLANAIRRCRIDFGVEITIDVADVTEKDPATGLCKAHHKIGTIKYPDKDQMGTILYIKTAMTDKAQADIREYFLRNPKFPQESTGDQFFDEAQFESYRKLGYDSI